MVTEREVSLGILPKAKHATNVQCLQRCSAQVTKEVNHLLSSFSKVRTMRSLDNFMLPYCCLRRPVTAGFVHDFCHLDRNVGLAYFL